MIISQRYIRSSHADWSFPDFNAVEYRKKQQDYVICVFVINEGDKVRRQIKEMSFYSKQIDIVIADGGSTDGSLDDEYLKKYKVRALLTKQGPGKLSAQMRMAFAWAIESGYKGVVVVDGNGKDDISAIPKFIEKLEQGYDHIQGSRYIPGGEAVNTPWLRHYALKLVHAPLISLASRRRQTDTTNGFRAYSRKLLNDQKINIFRTVFDTYELHYYLAIESARNGYNLTEIPVTRTYPRNGKIPTKISPLKGNIRLLIILIKASLRRY